MKILQVTPSLSPLHGGGVVEFVSQLSRTLGQRGHEVVIYTSDFELDQEYVNSLLGVKVYPFHSWSSLARFHITPGILWRAKKELKGFDVMHVHGRWSFQNIVVHHYAQQYGIPYVLTAYGFGPGIGIKLGLKRLYDIFLGNRFVRDASRVIAENELELKQYKGKLMKNIIKGKIEIVPLAVDLSAFSQLPMRGTFRRKYGIDDNQRVVLYLGRINAIKGIDLLVRSFAGLPKELGDAKLVIVGPDDGYLATLRGVISGLGVADRTLFTGSLYGSDKLAAYVDADVYVLASIYDALPLTVLEACACGIPVIITDTVGLATWIDGRAGYVVSRDEGQLRHALATILADKKVRQQLGRGGRKLIDEQFSLQRIAEQIESIYESISPRKNM